MTGPQGSAPGAAAGAASAAASSLPRGYALRPMQPGDLDAVHALETVLFPEDAWPRQLFDEELAHLTRQYWVVSRDREVVAYAGMMCIPPVADVQTIAVAAAHEGRGLGATLLRVLHEAAVGAGATEMMLEVRADNPRAQALYRRFGYEHIHTRAHYYGPGHDALIMRRELVPAGPGARSADGRTIHEHR
ncbi:ribosomal protein S18-alanine N-acetyltransferase [Kocuria tytonis]|uniref:Ribosomal-protein-alanine N-acetyltransferase n=1 Tax=Kocuria tytonis TaxID=2054280 RepID=A0A495AA59_9MICC|nr:ribosomal protein S18-alanine N-acetyltransferase [Kocuria tytonis]RKQ36888.1 ribosomal-protein-alanine N-acetyltransferase [Kocuria tytonis]